MSPSVPWSGLALHDLQDEIKARQLFCLWKPNDRQYLIAILKSNDHEFFNSIQAHRGKAFALLQQKATTLRVDINVAFCFDERVMLDKIAEFESRKTVLKYDADTRDWVDEQDVRA